MTRAMVRIRRLTYMPGRDNGGSLIGGVGMARSAYEPTAEQARKARKAVCRMCPNDADLILEALGLENDGSTESA